MNIILIGGAIALLATFSTGAYRVWRAWAARRHIQNRLQEYAGR